MLFSKYHIISTTVAAAGMEIVQPWIARENVVAKSHKFPICKDRATNRLPYIKGLRGQVAVRDNQLKLPPQIALDSRLHTHI